MHCGLRKRVAEPDLGRAWIGDFGTDWYRFSDSEVCRWLICRCRGTESNRFAAADPLQSLTCKGSGMKLTAAELAYLRAQRVYITEKCDACGELLNQTFRHTIAGKPQVYCSAACRDLVFFGDRREARKHSTPGKCVHCGATLEGKRREALSCDETCKKRAVRKGRAQSAATEPQITGTSTQSNQRITYVKNRGQGDRIVGPSHRSRIALGDSNPPAREPSM